VDDFAVVLAGADEDLVNRPAMTVYDPYHCRGSDFLPGIYVK
jgi:hypothetical protein